MTLLSSAQTPHQRRVLLWNEDSTTGQRCPSESYSTTPRNGLSQLIKNKDAMRGRRDPASGQTWPSASRIFQRNRTTVHTYLRQCCKFAENRSAKHRSINCVLNTDESAYKTSLSTKPKRPRPRQRPTLPVARFTRQARSEPRRKHRHLPRSKSSHRQEGKLDSNSRWQGLLRHLPFLRSNGSCDRQELGSRRYRKSEMKNTDTRWQ